MHKRERRNIIEREYKDEKRYKRYIRNIKFNRESIIYMKERGEERYGERVD